MDMYMYEKINNIEKLLIYLVEELEKTKAEVKDGKTTNQTEQEESNEINETPRERTPNYKG